MKMFVLDVLLLSGLPEIANPLKQLAMMAEVTAIAAELVVPITKRQIDSPTNPASTSK